MAVRNIQSICQYFESAHGQLTSFIHLIADEGENKFHYYFVAAIAALIVAIYQVSIPVGFIPNTRLQFNAAVIAIIGAIFGPVAGLFTGLISHTLGDALFYGGVWWSWVIADAVYGLLVGLTFKKLKIIVDTYQFTEIIIMKH